jgi:hypothetical protein
MPRLQIDVTAELHAKLKLLSERTGLSIACICRYALDFVAYNDIDATVAGCYSIKPGRKPRG